MKYTLLTVNKKLHLTESVNEETVCGIPLEDGMTERVVYNKDSFEEAVAEYLTDDLCEICFPEKVSTATFNTKAEIISTEDAGEFIEPVRGEKI